MEGETSKTYMFGSDNSMLPLLVSMFNQRGIDPSILSALNSNGGLGGANAVWILFLLFLFGNRGGNFLGGGNNASEFISSQINNTAGRDLLLQAIQGNSTALGQLTSSLNADFTAVQSSFTSILSAIQSVGSQVGLTGLQTINAIESGNATLGRQLCECCCENRLLTTQQGYESRIATIEQTNALGSAITGSGQRTADAIADLKASMIEQFCSAEKRDMQNEINTKNEIISTLKGQIDNANQTAAITGYVNNIVSPLAAKVGEIASKQLPTVPVVYPNIQAVNNTPYAGGFMGGFNPYGYGWGGSSYWG